MVARNHIGQGDVFIESHLDRAILVATVSEDAAADACARQMIGHILQVSASGMRVEEHAWSFKAWDKPDGMAGAGRRAGAADLVVVAVYRDTAALPRVIEWLRYWVAPGRIKRGALVFLSIERPGTPVASARSEEPLAQVAREIGMDFFATTMEAARTPDAGEG